MNLYHIKKLALVFIFFLSLTSCSEKEPLLSPLNNDAVILAFGDSLTYGTGANSDTQSYPAVLSQLTGLKVVNKGIPGEVSKTGLGRLPKILKEIKPDLVILCHGGNDIIRKLGKKQLKENLNKMIEIVQNSGAELVLIGVPNFSLMLNVPELYPELSPIYNIPIQLTILPKLERSLQLKSDQIHPNAKGYRLMAESIQTLLMESGAL